LNDAELRETESVLKRIGGAKASAPFFVEFALANYQEPESQVILTDAVADYIKAKEHAFQQDHISRSHTAESRGVDRAHEPSSRGVRGGMSIFWAKANGMAGEIPMQESGIFPGLKRLEIPRKSRRLESPAVHLHFRRHSSPP
jgi:hypothetical protein